MRRGFNFPQISSGDDIFTLVTKLTDFLDTGIEKNVEKAAADFKGGLRASLPPIAPREVSRPKREPYPMDTPPRRSAPSFIRSEEYGYDETYYRDRLRKHLEAMETLHQGGFLTDQEFRERKREILKLM